MRSFVSGRKMRMLGEKGRGLFYGNFLMCI